LLIVGKDEQKKQDRCETQREDPGSAGQDTAQKAPAR